MSSHNCINTLQYTYTYLSHTPHVVTQLHQHTAVHIHIAVTHASCHHTTASTHCSTHTYTCHTHKGSTNHCPPALFFFLFCWGGGFCNCKLPETTVFFLFFSICPRKKEMFGWNENAKFADIQWNPANMTGGRKLTLWESWWCWSWMGPSENQRSRCKACKHTAEITHANHKSSRVTKNHC